MKIRLHVWRQNGPHEKGQMVFYDVDHVSPDMSFLEMLDMVNENLVVKNDDPIAFDHDCREGICGACSLVINGVAHGPELATTTCQLHMRSFKDGDDIFVEPWSVTAFPVIKDLVTNRSAFDRIIQAGGFVSVNTGGVPDANIIPVGKDIADRAMDAATCIGCGACAAACKNSSAMLFVSAKVAHLSYLPQGQVEKEHRVINMLQKMDEEGFGGCSNTYECEAVCPKEIKVTHIAKLNREYLRALACSKKEE